MIQNDDRKVPHYTYKTTVQVWVYPSSDSDKGQMTVTWIRYHIRAADSGLLKIDRCLSDSPVSDNK